MNTSDVDFNQLIPELALWNNGKGIDVESWVCNSGSFELAVGYSRLFWPEFVEYEQCVFFADFSQTSYRGFMQQCDGDRARVEAVMNHRHLRDHFTHAYGAATEKQIVYLGRILKEIWQVKLAHDFPNRAFTVSFEEGPFENLLDYQITFRQA